MKAQYLLEMKHSGKKIAMLTAYDAPMARAFVSGGVDVLLVGDSVGTNLLGYLSEREVTMGDIIHHTKAVRRGAPQALVVADMPYGSLPNPNEAVENAFALRSAGADIVKFEGARFDILRALKEAGLSVCCHLGLEPQNHFEKRLKAKVAPEALKVLDDAKEMDALGMDLLVMELVPEELAATVTQTVEAPVIGIGAGSRTDGQVLVAMDALGYTPTNFRHNKRFAEFGALMEQTARSFVQEVRAGAFPNDAHAFKMATEELSAFLRTKR